MDPSGGRGRPLGWWDPPGRIDPMIGGSGDILPFVALLRTFSKLLDSSWRGVLGWYAPDPFGIGLFAGGKRKCRTGFHGYRLNLHLKRIPKYMSVLYTSNNNHKLRLDARTYCR